MTASVGTEIATVIFIEPDQEPLCALGPVEVLSVNGKILVVGGYGAVGRVAAAALGRRFPNEVIVAGRSYEKALEFSETMEGRVLPTSLDVNDCAQTEQALEGIGLVLMCLDQNGTKFVAQCLEKKVAYVDVTASYDFLLQIEALDERAKATGSTVALSVGLSPGLTNLLARHATSQLDEARHIDIDILLGLGEAHGEAALRWAVQNLNKTFMIRDDRTERVVRNFEDGKQALFPGETEPRTTFRFDFSDQHVLPRTLGVDSAATRIAFDSRLTTALFAQAQKAGLWRALRFRRAQDLVVRVLQNLRFGSEDCAVTVEARGRRARRNSVYRCGMVGFRESRTTGLVAAQVADELTANTYPAGVYHIEELFQPLHFVECLARENVSFHDIGLVEAA